MGSVEWGWQIDGAGTFTKLPLKKISDGVPTKEFMAAAEQWNKWTTAGTIKTTPDPTNVYDAAYSVADCGRQGRRSHGAGGMWQNAGDSYNTVTIKSGKEKGKTGRVKTNDMRDTGGGRATIDLPIQRVSTILAPIPRVRADLISGRGAMYSVVPRRWITGNDGHGPR